jgi:Flp pilus assembly pilin Flp
MQMAGESNMKQPRKTLTRLLGRFNVLNRIHRDERGGVSIETVLIIAAIALPILIFLIKVGWPRMQTFFNSGMDSLEQGAGTTSGGTGS